MKKDTARAVNCLAAFCGRRDHTAICRQLAKGKIDIAVLFGGSILAGGDLFARIIKEQLAATTIIVGGFGHTSQLLFDQAQAEIPGITDGIASEAELFDRYLQINYGLQSDYLEKRSTNCGNNITYLLELIQKEKLPADSMLIIQDATMQLRMEATLRKYCSDKTNILNYAAYQSQVIAADVQLIYGNKIHGMWPLDYYLRLLMGEIARLQDTPEGYGPKGKGFIAHVDVPQEVLDAYHWLEKEFPNSIRMADPRFSSRKSGH